MPGTTSCFSRIRRILPLIGILCLLAVCLLTFQPWKSADLRLLNISWAVVSVPRSGGTIFIPCAWVKGNPLSALPVIAEIEIRGEPGILTRSKATFRWSSGTRFWHQVSFGQLYFWFVPPPGETDIRSFLVSVNGRTFVYELRSFRIEGVPSPATTGGLTATAVPGTRDRYWRLIFHATRRVENLTVTGVSGFRFLNEIPRSMSVDEVAMVTCLPPAEGNFIFSPYIEYVDDAGARGTFGFTLFSFPRDIGAYLRGSGDES